MKLVPYSEEFKEINHAWRLENASALYNPHKQMSVEELNQHNLQGGSDLTRFREFDRIRLFALVDGEPVGNCSLRNINLQMLTAELGYLIGEKHYGKGLGTQMVSLFLQQVFEKSLLRRIEAVINVNNRSSVRLVEKLGFVREGLLREHYLLNGAPADNYLYSLLKGEFTPVD